MALTPTNTLQRTALPDVDRVKQRFGIIGNSPALAAAIERAVRVAPFALSVLVTGESGSGKEFFPKIIHQLGARKHKKYIAVNCGAIPEGTIDSELFGHEKGSFTGAISDRKGYFEEADGGTIFLDEVAELPLTTQARLLRVLETGEFLKVGSSKVQKTDIRIVAATNVDLLKAVSKGKFREDLYYRLSTVVINVPSLHDRGDDVILLSRKFARDFAETYMTEPVTFSESARRTMMLYSWPGNVRQLKNVVEQLALFNAGQEIGRDDMLPLLPAAPDGDSQLVAASRMRSYDSEREMLWQTIFALRGEIEDLRRTISGTVAADDTDRAPISNVRSLLRLSDEPDVMTMQPARSLEENEREIIEAALIRNGGNKRLTARELKISERTLYRKIHEYSLDSAGSKTSVQ